MGSYYQPASYLKGGKRRKSFTHKLKRKLRGGFTPSVMANVVRAGGFMIPLALRQGYMLFNGSHKKRKCKTLRKKHK